jgi:hypothetical protein
MGTKLMIAECLELMNRIEKESPHEPDLEALHSVTGIYVKLKKYRETIQTLPLQIRAFSEFLHTAKGSSSEIANFLSFIKDCPGAFCSEEEETFLEKRQRIGGIAERAGLEPARLFHLLSMARLKGILNKKDNLIEDFHSVIVEYLEPEATG